MAKNTIAIDDLIHRLGGAKWNGRSYQAKCPCHHDRKPSLTVQLAASGNILMYCFAGCDTRDVARVLGIEMADLCSGSVTPPKDPIEHLAILRRWSRDAFQAIGAKAVEYEVHFPMRDAEGAITGYRRRRGDGDPYRGGMKALSKRGSKNGLLGPWPIPAEGDVLVVEGEADLLAALTHGHAATVATPGAGPGGRVIEALQRVLAHRRVILAPDPDDAGLKWRDTLAQALVNAGCDVQYLPADRVDLDKRLRSTPLENLLTAVVPWKADAGVKPTVRLAPGDQSNAVDAMREALRQSNLPLYVRAEGIVHPVVHAEPHDAVQRPADALVIRQLTPESLSDMLARVAIFERWDGRMEDYRPCDPPMGLIRILLATPDDSGLPRLHAVSRCPLLRLDGRRITEGHDRCILIDAPGEWPDLPEHPTRDDAIAAIDRIEQVFRHFPWKGPVDRAVALAMAISAVMRPALPTCPGFVIGANAAGTGKSLFVDAVALLATGTRASVIEYTADPAEFAKRLDACLVAGDAAITIDNVEAVIEGAALCSTLSQPARRIRLLGHTEMITVPCMALLTVTANNPVLRGDVVRRMLTARLDAGCERPELRRFNQDILRDVAERRGELVRDLHTIVAAYIQAGMPATGCAPLGGFEKWAQYIRDALVWAGQADAAQSIESTRAEDPSRQNLAALLTAWHDALGQHPTTAADVIRASADHPDLREALEAVALNRGELCSRKLGYWLRKNRDVFMEKMTLRRNEKPQRTGTYCWSVRMISTAGDTGDAGDIPNPTRGNVNKVERTDHRGGAETSPSNYASPAPNTPFEFAFPPEQEPEEH